MLSEKIRNRASKLLHRNENEWLGGTRTQKIAKFINRLTDGADQRLREEAFVGGRPTAEAAVHALNETGFHIDPNLDTSEVVKVAKALVSSRQDLIDEGRETKPFLINVYKPGQDNFQHRMLVDFALQSNVLDVASEYCKFVPLLTAVKVLVSLPPPGGMAQARSSQLFHLDNADLPFQHCKLFINVDDVSPKNGPFTFLSAPDSDKISAAINYGHRGIDYRVKDEVVEQLIGTGRSIAISGPAGRSVFIDTSRCFHLGSRVEEQRRVVIMYQFTSACQARLHKPVSFARFWRDGMSNAQKMVLGAH